MDVFKYLEDVNFRFAPQPTSLPPDLRPLWRMTMMALFLRRCCRQEKSSLKKLHVLNWAIRNSNTRQTLLDLLEGKLHPDKAIVRFDPATNRAIEMARGEGLIEQVGGDRYQITAKGQKLADEALSIPNCLTTEKWFIGEIAGKVTETQIDRILGATQS